MKSGNNKVGRDHTNVEKVRNQDENVEHFAAGQIFYRHTIRKRHSEYQRRKDSENQNLERVPERKDESVVSKKSFVCVVSPLPDRKKHAFKVCSDKVVRTDRLSNSTPHRNSNNDENKNKECIQQHVECTVAGG